MEALIEDYKIELLFVSLAVLILFLVIYLFIKLLGNFKIDKRIELQKADNNLHGEKNGSKTPFGDETEETRSSSLYQAGLYLKQSANLNFASIIIMVLGVLFYYFEPHKKLIPVFISISLASFICSIISIVKKKQAGKELMLVNMK